MKYEVIDIKWDTDGEDIGLPDKMIVHVDIENFEDDYEISEYISDEISNMTGFCHFGFNTIPELKEQGEKKAEYQQVKGEDMRCPKCGSEQISWGAAVSCGAELDGDCVCHPAFCIDCESELKFYYNLKFDSVWIKK